MAEGNDQPSIKQRLQNNGLNQIGRKRIVNKDSNNLLKKQNESENS